VHVVQVLVHLVQVSRAEDVFQIMYLVRVYPSSLVL
jgi:hypothetical protein